MSKFTIRLPNWDGLVNSEYISIGDNSLEFYIGANGEAKVALIFSKKRLYETDPSLSFYLVRVNLDS